MAAISSTSQESLVAIAQRDTKAVFFAFFLLILTSVQGIRISDVPIPFALFFATLYLLLFQPPIPSAAPRIYALVISYLLILSTRNALSSTGSFRDFLYIGICFANFAITVALFDIFRAVGAKKVGVALLIVAAFEVMLQLLEVLNVGGFNSLVAPLLRFWANQTNSQGFLRSAALAERAPGTFGSPTAAALVLYLVIRGAAVILRRRQFAYLSIVPIIIGGGRSALIIFLIWEIFVQSLLYWRRNFALAMLGLSLVSVGAIVLLAFPHLLSGLFLYRAFDVSAAQFSEGFSVVNRLRSIEWALQHWPQFVSFGGITSRELASRMSWQGSALDSELILRSLQFGFAGFLCLLASNVWTGLFWKNQDSWFILFFAVISSLTNSMLTDFVLFPFVIIYCLCVNISQHEPLRGMNGLTPVPR